MNWKQSFAKLVAPSIWIERFIAKPVYSQQICTDCGQIGLPVRRKHGTDEMEIGLWLVMVGFGVLYVVTDFLHTFTWEQYHHFFPPGIVVRAFSMVTKVFLFLGPGCTLWRISTQQTVCPKCEHPTMIPLDSPKGQRVKAESEQHSK